MDEQLHDGRLHRWLEQIDEDLAEAARAEGCRWCGGRLHRADYTRKPRGGPRWEKRWSFCCAREGCRRRMTPPSVRFLGRRVYVGIVVVLVSAMAQGATEARVRRLREALGIDPRTLSRWRRWWAEEFRFHAFWQVHRGRFLPPLEERRLPWGLVEAFGAGATTGLVKLMRFLSPLSTRWSREVRVM